MFLVTMRECPICTLGFELRAVSEVCFFRVGTRGKFLKNYQKGRMLVTWLLEK